jgi:cytochrome c oxidase subunit 2
MGETPEDALQIDVFAQQFAWNIRYPGPDGIFGRVDSALIDELSNPMGIDRSDAAAIDDVVVINQLYVPVDRPVQVTLRSRDVIHSFFLPNFRVKQDAVPGMSIPVWFVPTQEGRFELACTELCGLGHYRMMGFFNVLPQGEFEDWLQQQYASN